MKFLTAKSRVTIGLVCLMTSLMATAMFMGVGPSERGAIMKGRAALSETIALDCAIHLNQQDMNSINSLLSAVAQRNPEIRTAAIRQNTGDLAVIVGEHQAKWNTKRAADTHIRVPLYIGDSEWGHVELLFEPVNAQGLVGWLAHPWLQYIGLVGALGFIVFSFYLGVVLRQLDPSNAVPKRVRAALDTLAEGLILTDSNGRVVLANDAFAQWLGRSPEKLVGQNAAKFAWAQDSSPDPDQQQELPLEFPWDAALKNQVPQARWLLNLMDSNKTCLNLVANSSPILGQDGSYQGVLTSFEDITELEQNKVELIAAKTAADDANEAKSEFLARMSHEIRTPMNAILGYTEVLRRGYVDNESDRQKHLKTIETSGEHLLALINDILDLSKVESGNIQLELRHCSVQAMLSHVVSVMQIKAQEKDIELNFRGEGLVPETIVTDEVRLRQTLINLVGNAIKFTEAGRVDMIVQLIHHEHQPKLQIDVVDTGIGISESQIEKIFDPFAQADSSITRRFGGTGLGLCISKQLVEKMGGTIAVSSVPRKGSRFSISLDPGCLDNVSRVELDADLIPADDESSPNEQLISFPGARILVVDDGESNRELVGLLLRRAGAQVVMAENGLMALNLIVDETFDAALMDMQMPVMDGFTATQEIRNRGLEIPVIALTANIMRDDEEKCRKAGCTGFITKPVREERLLKTLASCLPDLAQGGGNNLESSLPADAELNNQSAILTCEEPNQPPLLEASKDSGAIEPSLPMDDPDYRHIVQLFLKRLSEQFVELQIAAEDQNFEMVADLAHWLRGSGETAGFPVFTQVASSLEKGALSKNQQLVQQHVATIESIVRRIRIPASDSVGPVLPDVLHSSVGDNGPQSVNV